MSHLSTERLAALADEPGMPAELAHLASCEACARERRAYAALLALAAQERARIGEPLTTWEGIAGAGAGGGRRAAGGGTAATRRTGRRVWRDASRVAAAAVLLAGGVVAGRYSAGAPALPNEWLAARPALGGTSAERPAATGTPAAQPLVGGMPDTVSPAFTSVADARAARTRYEAMYQSASAFIAQHDTGSMAPESPAAMRTRLAALDRVDRAMREAMHAAPYDPVINGYYLTTIGQRERTLHQLNTVLPVGMRINSF